MSATDDPSAADAGGAIPAALPDRRPLLSVLAANVVSVLGTSLTFLAVPWFVLETTGSAARTGLVAFCATVPVAASALLGGPLIDRFGRRRTSVGTDLLCGVTVAAVPLLHAAGLLPFWLLCVLMAVNGLFHAPGETARSVLLPALAERAGTPLVRAAGFFDGVSRGARMAGTALAGLLIATLGAEAVLLLDALTFAVSAAIIAVGLRGFTAAGPVRATGTVSPRAYAGELADGFRFLLRLPLLWGITAMVLVTNSLDAGWSSVLLPVHAREHLGGPVDLGLLFAVGGAGALAGALLYGSFGHRLPRWPVFTCCFLVAGAPRMLVAALGEGLVPLLVMMAVGGLAAGALNPILTTVLYERVPDAMRSRVMGISYAGALAATPMGSLAAGFLVEGAGLSVAVLGFGAVYLLVTLAPVGVRSFRGMDDPPPAAAPRTATEPVPR
ncbi:MFS transporter [Streptomyces sp. 549]|uniref:MFS transporter n=1 Tax=Streptomyces sp. 549 TaxID=3049076 RepID=UPI0024C47000|nr:MFS transporter [Streptomyces sp. 549]MDK1475250.1 MFS transporter [Streptomyces sp. 549]